MDDRTKTPQDTLTIDQAAQRFGVSRRTIERLRSNGSLPGVRVGRFLRIRVADVEQALASQNPEQLFRLQLHPKRSMTMISWFRGWEQLAHLTLRKPADRAAAIRWISTILTNFEDLEIEKLGVGDVLECSTDARLTPSLSLLSDTLRGIDPERPMIEILRELLPLIVPNL
ncbi:MAG: DNA-binding protein [Phycisphaera sp. TMED9]|nr:MAG: DNA-binding protein [Phycisphaera sp. TMED9]